jgi:hypothetical protein
VRETEDDDRTPSVTITPRVWPPLFIQSPHDEAKHSFSSPLDLAVPLGLLSVSRNRALTALLFPTLCRRNILMGHHLQATEEGPVMHCVTAEQAVSESSSSSCRRRGKSVKHRVGRCLLQPPPRASSSLGHIGRPPSQLLPPPAPHRRLAAHRPPHRWTPPLLRPTVAIPPPLTRAIVEQTFPVSFPDPPNGLHTSSPTYPTHPYRFTIGNGRNRSMAPPPPWFPCPLTPVWPWATSPWVPASWVEPDQCWPKVNSSPCQLPYNCLDHFKSSSNQMKFVETSNTFRI